MLIFNMFLKFCTISFVVTIVALFSDGLEFKEVDITLLEKAYQEYRHSGLKPPYFKDVIGKIQFPNFFKHDNSLEEDADENHFCLICKTFTNFLIELVRAGATRDQLVNEVSESCLNFGIGTARVCKGIANLNVDIFVDIVQKHPELTGKNLCGIRYTSKDCELSNDSLVDWSVNIPSGSSKPRSKPTVPKEGLKILHISDIHYDTLYTPNKTIACGEPLCCQNDQADGDAANGTTCGFWGDYSEADSPSYLLPEVLKDIRTRDFDYVYFTGDIVSHRTWETNVPFNTKVLKDVYEQFRKSFNVPVYPVMGNHEPTPANVYYFSDEDKINKTLSTKWLYELAVKEWSDWLPPDTFETILKGGFYTVSPKKGFRIVVLNNNIAHNTNWWLVDSTYDPYEQLAWLVQVLDKAEKNNESVHILSHFPSGKGLLKVWSKEYNKIVKRYCNTITAQFNGHSHYDQFVVYYKKKDNDEDNTVANRKIKDSHNRLNKKSKYEPINIAFNGASITTLGGVNPSYKIYSVADTIYDVLDFEEYTFNLTQVNIANYSSDTPLQWYKLYSFTEAYNVTSLVAKELDALLYRACKDHTLLDQYHNYRYRNADPALKQGCDDDCKKAYLCEMSKSQKGKKDQCKMFQDLYDNYNI